MNALTFLAWCSNLKYSNSDSNQKHNQRYRMIQHILPLATSRVSHKLFLLSRGLAAELKGLLNHKDPGLHHFLPETHKTKPAGVTLCVSMGLILCSPRLARSPLFYWGSQQSHVELPTVSLLQHECRLYQEDSITTTPRKFLAGFRFQVYIYVMYIYINYIII